MLLLLLSQNINISKMWHANPKVQHYAYTWMLRSLIYKPSILDAQVGFPYGRNGRKDEVTIFLNGRDTTIEN